MKKFKKPIGFFIKIVSHIDYGLQFTYTTFLIRIIITTRTKKMDLTTRILNILDEKKISCS